MLKRATNRATRCRRACGGLLLCLLAAVPWRHLPAQPPQEARRVLLLKAGILTRLPSYLYWPGEKEGGAGDARVTFCILGDSELDKPLREVAGHSLVKGAPPRVRILPAVAEAGGCHVLFIPRAREPALDEILAALAGRPILTVADTPGFRSRGVAVNLFLEEQRVRFSINLEALEQSGITASFRLLESARTSD